MIDIKSLSKWVIKMLSNVQPLPHHQKVDITHNKSKWNTMRMKSNSNSTRFGITKNISSDSGFYSWIVNSLLNQSLTNKLDSFSVR